MAARIAREHYGKIITLGGLSLLAYGAYWDYERVRRWRTERDAKEREFHQWRWPRMSRQQKERECHQLYLKQLRKDLLNHRSWTAVISTPVRMDDSEMIRFLQLKSAAAVFGKTRCKDLVQAESPEDGWTSGLRWAFGKHDLAIKHDLIELEKSSWRDQGVTCTEACPYCDEVDRRCQPWATWRKDAEVAMEFREWTAKKES